MTHFDLKRAWRPALELTILSAFLFAAGLAMAAEPERIASAKRVEVPSSALTVRIKLADSMKDAAGDVPGTVRFTLFDTEADYRADRTLIDRSVRVRGGHAEIPLEGLRPGHYAFRIFHDANGNGELDTGAFGIPKERYFFSNGASDLFSAPEWSEASFRLSEGAFAYEVELD